MELYSTLSSTDEDVSLHLVQLPKTILNEIKSSKTTNNSFLYEKYNLNPKNIINIKSLNTAENGLYLTSFDKTFKIRKQNHSNCVMLFKDNFSFQKFSSYLIIENGSAHEINLQNIDIKTLNSIADIKDDGSVCSDMVQLNAIFKVLKKIYNNSIVSIDQFDKVIPDLGIIPAGEGCFKIGKNLEIALISKIILNFMESSTDLDHSFTNDEVCMVIETVYNQLKMKNHVLKRIITYIVLKYCKFEKDENVNAAVTEDYFLKFSIYNGNYGINHEKIIKFLTIDILSKEGSILLDDLLIKIRLNLPINYLPDFKMDSILKGISYSTNTKNNQQLVNFLDGASFQTITSGNLLFEKLFKLKSIWPIEEIEPYIKPISVKNMKIEKFCIKYCKIKKEKGKVYLSKR